MQHASYFNELCKQYQGKALFTGVYIVEAHAADEWPVGPRLSFCNQTKSVDERCNLASDFSSEFELAFPFLVDTMENHFMETFAAWPFRYYVIQHGRVVFKAMPNEERFGYNVTTLGKWLSENVK